MISRCSRCGHELQGDDIFCAMCGAARRDDDTAYHGDLIELAEALDADHELAASIALLPPGTALLVVRKGPNTPSRYFVERAATTIGRHPASDVPLDDVTVSRRHAMIRRAGGCFTIEDLGSLNGTYVGGERTEASPLEQLNEIRVGVFTLVFIRGAEPGQPLVA